MKNYDVIIIGGGASGLAAAVELGTSSPDLDVLVIEKNDELGRKIRATGSGRCNITNTAAEGYEEILAFLTKLGLMTKTLENGLVYPYSESAADVVCLLADKVHELGIDVITGEAVTGLVYEEPGFSVACGKKMFTADNVILAVGGKAGPSYGTTGDGYALARSVGHSIVTPVPVLTSVECCEWESGAISLAGTRSRGKVSLFRDGNAVFEEAGEIQFTKYGLSGICVFNMSRHMRYNRSAGESLEQFKVKLNLFPDGDIGEYIEDRRNGLFSGEPVGALLRTVLKENIAEYVLKTADDKIGRKTSVLESPIASLTDSDIAVISDCIHGLEFNPSSIRGWKDAQATSGGVSLDEIDADSCESKICEGLYITGELMDYDGPCGGFNLSNAWLTGIKAARAIV